RDLDLEVEVIGCPTVREADGLALSSRNRFLSLSERDLASRLPQTLRTAAAAVRAGKPIRETEREAGDTLSAAGYMVDYVAVRDAETLDEALRLAERPLRILAAARLGSTRLIDNWQI
ncbi:MAG: pantoate--beta-alanine ligase, partial [Beijerinckiaceae bacterium]